MEGTGFGIAFYGDRGTLVIGQKNWRIEDGGEKTPLGHSGEEGQARHVQNFLDCVKSRSAPSAEIEVGHLSTRLCHLGNIAFRLGRKLTFDGSREAFHDGSREAFHDPEANRMLAREYGSRFEMPSQV
jgi:Oxidoreductase family, C-terminal alpha/beta domain